MISDAARSRACRTSRGAGVNIHAARPMPEGIGTSIAGTGTIATEVPLEGCGGGDASNATLEAGPRPGGGGGAPLSW